MVCVSGGLGRILGTTLISVSCVFGGHNASLISLRSLRFPSGCCGWTAAEPTCDGIAHVASPKPLLQACIARATWHRHTSHETGVSQGAARGLDVGDELGHILGGHLRQRRQHGAPRSVCTQEGARAKSRRKVSTATAHDAHAAAREQAVNAPLRSCASSSFMAGIGVRLRTANSRNRGTRPLHMLQRKCALQLALPV